VLPYWTVAPFAAMLLSIAIVPLVWGHWWESNQHKGALSAALGGLVLAYLTALGPEGAGERILVTMLDYVAFIALLGSLFVISGGIFVRGSLRGTPAVNAAILAVGAVLASFMGTTGAAMLLIRPLLRANAWRQARAHVVVFFIFVVANGGGLLTPLGDPPLYLGFLKGVPFEWTLRLWPEWLVLNSVVILCFLAYDTVKYRAELAAGRSPGERGSRATRPGLRVEGAVNVLWLGCIVATIFGAGVLATSELVHELESEHRLLTEIALKLGQAVAMVAVALLSLRTTKPGVRESNGFNYAPIIEVAVLFVGIFLTMIPALWILDELGQRGELGLDEPWQFFWAAGGLSSFLDNAPTYLTFSAAASGLHHTDPSVLSQLIASTGQVALPDGASLSLAPGEDFLRAISCGAVFMGANTYIGNGPNFMVKTIAEQEGVAMPSFFGYMVYSLIVLVPIFAALTFVFFRS
jgi:Na+/H+ antiporter NhaD/arsenite permease-like protein